MVKGRKGGLIPVFFGTLIFGLCSESGCTTERRACQGPILAYLIFPTSDFILLYSWEDENLAVSSRESAL